LSAALVPVLSEYATSERQRELEHILSILLSIAVVAILVVTVMLELLAPWITPLLVSGLNEELIATGTRLVRIVVPAILIYGLSGILQAYHYARSRFVYPSMGAPAHNLGMIVAIVFLAGRLQIEALAVGTLVAATTQLLVQLPGLRGAHLAWRFDWRHPAVRRIAQLYAPVVLSIVIQNVGIIIDRNLASRTVEEAITWMADATFLIQLPLGLVSMAISLAVLPRLSQIDAYVELDRFKRTFSLGLRLVLVVIIPAAVGLWVLGKPIIELIFEHGAFLPSDTAQTWRALQYYLFGLPFAAIDLPLIFAFYAQKDTATPVMVGILGVLVYLAVGPVLAFRTGLGYYGLVIANSVQLTAHALLMLVMFRRRFAGLRGYGVLRATGKALGASVPLAVLAGGSYALLQRAPLPGGVVGKVLLVGVCGTAGLAGYLLGARWLHIEDLDAIWEMLRRKFAGRA
jgi:putative peptidoglycan lipid II flippase